MSFEKFMSDWSNGKRALDTKNTYYEIRPSTNSLQECEVLQKGIVSIEDNNLKKEHISWLRNQENSFICCYYIDNEFRELNFKQLDTIFGEEIRKGGILNNSQMLSNGIIVPIVPQKFIDDVLHKHEQKKRRVLYSQKIKKKNIKQMNNMLWFFNMESAPREEELYESIHMIPPNLLRSDNPKQEYAVVENVRERTIKILETTRNKIINHPVYNSRLKSSIFENVNTVSDFLKLSVEDDNGNKINIAHQLVGLFNILFPLK